MALWEDNKFTSNNAALYEEEGKVAEYDIGTNGSPTEVYWLRPNDEFPTGNNLADPQLFVDGDEAGDVSEGSMDDAWFIGALAAVAAHPLALVQNLFVDEDEDAWAREGRLACRFYKDGEWIEVPVDTKIPMKLKEKEETCVPLYGRCRNPEEQWIQMVEKAYAKLHGTYNALSGGHVGDALVDLTGGSAQTIVLTDDPVAEMVSKGRLWPRIQRYLDYYYVITCEKTVSSGMEDIKDGEVDLVTGLKQSRAYSILCAKEIGALRFIKIRNPWGEDAAWRGEWSDGSPKWEEHPEVEQAMKEDTEIGFDRTNKDGTFWMVWEDFVRQFDTLCMCRLFGEEFNQYLIQGEWEGRTAAGAHKIIRDSMATTKKGKKNTGNVKRSPEKKTADEEKNDGGPRKRNVHISNRRGTFTETDGDPRWFNNPQYRLVVEKETECYISLMQKDRRVLRHGDSHYSIGFVVLRQKKNEKGRIWEQDLKYTITDSSKSRFAGLLPRREVTKASIVLSPKYHYIIVPYTREWGVEMPYTMRIFTRQEMKVEALPELFCKTYEGSWTIGEELDTAGGPLTIKGTEKENLKFCQNPQYLVRLPKTKDRVSLKVVLKRTDKNGVVKGKREGKTNFPGLVIVKPDPPPATGKKKRIEITNFMGEPLSPHKRAEAKAKAARISRGEEIIEEDKTVGKVSRKLSIAKGDWCCNSDFSDREAATCTLPTLMQIWCENGMIIVPVLQQPGMEGSYMLEVFSEIPISMEEMPQTREKTVASSWTENLSGGMHMNENWKRNPKFSLELFTDRPAKVDITLSRPEDRWGRRAVKDSVGTMMGFYCVSGTRITKEPTGIFYDGKPWTQTPYMPVHKISTPPNFMLQPLNEGDVYTILPTTFEPDRHGPFFVTVKADCDFRLTTK